MRIRAVAVAVLLALSACSEGGGGFANRSGGGNPLAPASSDEIADAVAAFQPDGSAGNAGRSALDSLSANRRSELDATAAMLVGLLPSPDAIGSFRLANLQVDDPNGDGRIGQYWYPPRVLRQECSAKVDAAPGPYAAATYVPGSGLLDDAGPMVAFDVMSSALVVGVQVQLFDDASQRDAYLATTLEFYRDPTFPCGGNTSSMQTFRESELLVGDGTVVAFEPVPDFLGGGVSGYLAVGDRVLLAVSISNDAVDSPWTATDLERWLGPALQVALARLGIAELP